MDLFSNVVVKKEGISMQHFCSLSEAIREGAKLRPQTTALFEVLPSGVIGSCAIGAAYEAMTGRTYSGWDDASVYVAVKDSFPYMSLRMVQCPEGCISEAWLESTIMHLNDDHGWTRERIADWVEGFEESIGFITFTEGERSESSVHSLQTVVV